MQIATLWECCARLQQAGGAQQWQLRAVGSRHALIATPAKLAHAPPRQAGAATALQLAQSAAGAVGDGLHAAAAPLAVFDAGWGTNLLFWAVCVLFLYNLVVLAPRQ